MIRKIITCMDLRAIPLGMATVFAGGAAAAIHGNFETLPFTLTLFFVIFAQISANLYHRYCDSKYHYGENIDQGIVDNGPISLVVALREACLAATLVACTLGIGIMTMSGWWVILIGICMYGISYFNSSGPYPLARSPFGIIPPFIFFGPLGVISMTYIQADYDGGIDPNVIFDLGPSIFLGCAIGFFAVNSLLYYNYMNATNDCINGKRTFRVVFGATATRILFLTNNLLIYGASAYVVFRDHLPHPWLILCCPFICMLINLYLWWNMRKDNRKHLIAMAWVNNCSALFYAVTALIIFTPTGVADDSILRIF